MDGCLCIPCLPVCMHVCVPFLYALSQLLLLLIGCSLCDWRPVAQHRVSASSFHCCYCLSVVVFRPYKHACTAANCWKKLSNLNESLHVRHPLANLMHHPTCSVYAFKGKTAHAQAWQQNQQKLRKHCFHAVRAAGETMSSCVHTSQRFCSFACNRQTQAQR